GAALFGKFVHYRTERIESGAARTVFLEVLRKRAPEAAEPAPPSLVCVLPRGASSEQRFEITGLTLEVQTNSPARVQAYYSNRASRTTKTLLKQYQSAFIARRMSPHRHSMLPECASSTPLIVPPSNEKCSQRRGFSGTWSSFWEYQRANGMPPSSVLSGQLWKAVWLGVRGPQTTRRPGSFSPVSCCARGSGLLPITFASTACGVSASRVSILPANEARFTNISCAGG